MKKVIISLVLLAMLAGCLGQAGTAQPAKEEVGNGSGNVTADAGAAKNESATGFYNRTYNINSSQSYDWRDYDENETVDAAGLTLFFKPGLPMFIERIERHDFSNLKESDGAYIFVQGKKWDIARLRGPNATMGYYVRTESGGNVEDGVFSVERPELIVGEGHCMVLYQCESAQMGDRTYALHVGTGQVWFDENISNCTGYLSEVFDPVPELSLNETNNLRMINGKWVQLRQAMPVDVAWAYICVYDKIVDLTGDSLVKTEWDANETGNPKLISVFIPRSSPIFENLTGQSSD